jgi:uncharacterized protein (DUF983 family)
MGPEVLLLLGKQCSQMGLEYCVTGAADSLEWVTMLDANILSMALKWPAVLLRKLPNSLAGSYVLLLEILSIVLDRPMLRSVGRSVRRGRWGVCPECRQGVERICRAITKQVQQSDARIEVDVMHTGNECTE